MTRRTKYLIVILASILTVFLLWQFWPPSAGFVVTLPDGRVVALEAVTFGTSHRFVRGKVWLKVAAPVLPDRWLTRFGLQITAHQTAQPCLMVWLRWLAPNNELGPGSDASVASVEGSETEPVRPKVTMYPSRLETITGWEFPNFPRRAPTIDLRLYDRDRFDTPQRLASFTIRNPASKKYPQWARSPPAVAQSNEQARFLLTKLGPSSVRPFWGKIAGWSEARFNVQTATGRDWRINRLTISDATGNLVTIPPELLRFNGHSLNPCFNAVLWPNENAHRLQVEFVPTDGFSPDEVYETQLIPIPAAGSSARLGSQVQIQGGWLFLQSLRHRIMAGPLSSGAARERAYLAATVIPADSGLHLTLFQATDGAGVRLRHEMTFARPNGQHEFMIHLRPDTKALQLSMAVHRGQTVEFLATRQKKIDQAEK